MEILKIIVFYLLLFDAIIVNFIAWRSPNWVENNFKTFSRFFPITKGWATLYLMLVLWIGFLTLIL